MLFHLLLLVGTFFSQVPSPNQQTNKTATNRNGERKKYRNNEVQKAYEQLVKCASYLLKPKFLRANLWALNRVQRKRIYLEHNIIHNARIEIKMKFLRERKKKREKISLIHNYMEMQRAKRKIRKSYFLSAPRHVFVWVFGRLFIFS